jgi:hypothetical protein
LPPLHWEDLEGLDGERLDHRIHKGIADEENRKGRGSEKGADRGGKSAACELPAADLVHDGHASGHGSFHGGAGRGEGALRDEVPPDRDSGRREAAERALLAGREVARPVADRLALLEYPRAEHPADRDSATAEGSGQGLRRAALPRADPP